MKKFFVNYVLPALFGVGCTVSLFAVIMLVEHFSGWLS